MFQYFKGQFDRIHSSGEAWLDFIRNYLLSFYWPADLQSKDLVDQSTAHSLFRIDGEKGIIWRADWHMIPCTPITGSLSHISGTRIVSLLFHLSFRVTLGNISLNRLKNRSRSWRQRFIKWRTITRAVISLTNLVTFLLFLTNFTTLFQCNYREMLRYHMCVLLEKHLSVKLNIKP